MTCRGDEEVDKVTAILEHFTPGQLATLAILGNHDYGRGFSQVWVADRLTRRLEGMGIKVLRNQIHTVAGLQIAGIDDLWSPCYDLGVVAALDRQRASLVLCHNPDAADRPDWSGYQGWILCGHTHGGQCRLPFCDPPIIPVNNPRYTQGIIDLEDGRILYINPGLGYLRRVRFNVPPEITVFTLTSAECSETSG
jgi:predicted MPP superfamily phosphohydrolase